MSVLSGAALLIAGVTTAEARTPTPEPAPMEVSATAPSAPVGHVFVINLENESAQVTFGPNSAAPYLSKTLTAKGQLLTNYYGIGHNSLDNYVAQISGQAPNPHTQADCPLFTDFVGKGTAASGQAIGMGCVYPSSVKTVADQLTAKGRGWKAYAEDMGNSSTESANCRHPAINGRDDTQQAKVGDQYAARHNPFVYFHSLLDSGQCAKRDVPLTHLKKDLGSVSTTANLTYITPNLCHDGHDSPCVDGKPGGLKSADGWLKSWVPTILASPAFKQDGALVITFDEAEASGAQADATACCGEKPGPNSPLPGISGPGGGRTGAVVLSRYVRQGSTNATPYNHYALLRSIEDAFCLPHLGYAGQPGLRSFGTDVFNAVHAPRPVHP